MKLEIKGLDLTIKRVEGLAAESRSRAQAALNGFAFDVRNSAKDYAPKDEGHLKGSIEAVPGNGNLEASIVVATNYAAYMEFGTRKFAAKYVATLPPDWQVYAATFKGRGGGNFAEMLRSIMEWVRRKGLGSGFGGPIGVTGTYSIKTRKRTGSKSVQQRENEQAAYVIARSILINGVRPQPFLRPATRDHIPTLTTDLKAIFK